MKSVARTGRRVFFSVIPFLVVLLAFSSVPQQKTAVPDPSTYLGIDVGADKVLADWGQISGYFRAVAQASPRVKLVEMGTSQNKRPMLAALISSDENIAHIDQLLRLQHEITWMPRQKDEATRWNGNKAFVLINCSMHANEIGASQMSMLLLHRLATEDSAEMRQAREKLVVVLMPSSNPDGIDWMVDWYRKYLGTPYEGSTIPFLFQEYAGHDNNRDWFMLNLRETQVINALMSSTWFPEIVWDAHQMGGGGIRAFVPPFLGPPNPMIHPLVLTGIENTGHAMRAQMIRDNHYGVSHSVSFSVWWNGGFRTTPYFKNSIGLLTELASARLATPMEVAPAMLKSGRGGVDATIRSVRNPAPWLGGTWRLRDIIDYELSAAKGLINYASCNAGRIVGDYRTMSLDAIEMKDGDAAAWIIPTAQHDPGAADRLIWILRQHGVLVRQLAEDLKIGEESFAAGSAVIPGDQPFRPLIRSLLERVPYPAGLTGDEERPYDVTGWTLTDMLGVSAKPLTAEEFGGTNANLADFSARERMPLSTSTGQTYYPAGDSDSYRAVARILTAGGYVTVERNSADGSRFVQYDPGHDASGMDISGVIADAKAKTLRLPRLALLRGNFNNMDEGWTRWMLDQFDFPYSSLDEKRVMDGDLRADFDAIIIPNISEQQLIGGSGGFGGMAPPETKSGFGRVGMQSLEKFVLDGGTLICFGQSARAAIINFELPVVDVTRGLRDDDLSIPGSLLGIDMDSAHPLALGMAAEAGAMYDRSTAFDVPQGRGATDRVTVAARYAPLARLLLSGYARGGEKIAGKAALVAVRHGEGSVVLFGFQPQFRGQTWATFKCIFNAVLWAGSGERFAPAPQRSAD